jgi:hypothetical protein
LGSWLSRVALVDHGAMWGATSAAFAALDAGVGIGQAALAGAEGLDLGSGQHDAGLDRVLDRESVARPPVEGDGLLSPMAQAPGRGSVWTGGERCGRLARPAHSRRVHRTNAGAATGVRLRLPPARKTG